MAISLTAFQVSVMPAGTSFRRSRVVLAKNKRFAEQMVTRYPGDRLVIGTPNPFTAAWLLARGNRKPSSTEIRDFYREFKAALKSEPNPASALKQTVTTIRCSALANAVVAAMDPAVRALGGVAVLQALSGVLPFEHVERMKAAVATGNLPAVVEKLAATSDKGVKIMGGIIQALIMPVVTITGAIGAGIYIAKMQLPAMAALFATSKAPLPTPTLVLLKCVDVIEAFPPLMVLPPLLPILAFVGLPKLYATTGWFQDLVDRLPVVGRLLEYTRWARVLRTLSMLLSSLKGYYEPLEFSARSTTHLRTKKFLRGVRDTITAQGLDIYEAAQRHLHVLGGDVPRWIDLLPIGVASGNVPAQLESAADDYEERAEFAVGVLPKVLEILAIMLSGLIVGSIMAAVLYPSMKLGAVLK